MEFSELKKIFDEFSKLKNDVERFKFLINHPGNLFVFRLDNDTTYVNFSEDVTKNLTNDQNDEIAYFGLDSFIGDSEGIFYLLEALGFKANGV